MINGTGSKIAKWPFLVGDALLVGLAAVILLRSESALSVWQMAVCVVAVGGGAWLAVTPFLVEYRAAFRLAESVRLQTVLERFANLEAISGQIKNATAHWQTAQAQADRTVTTAGNIADRLGVEAKAFTEFLQKANDTERANLRLEIEKLHRAEGEWLQVVTRILDHVFALQQAAVRSAQPTLIEQLGQFQNACRDTARRLGLVPFAAPPDGVFDEKIHQLVDPQEVAPADSRVVETIAAGYTYQGQLLRRALVALGPPRPLDRKPAD